MVETKAPQEHVKNDPFVDWAFRMIKPPSAKVEEILRYGSMSGFRKRVDPDEFIQYVSGGFDLKVMRHPKVVDLAASRLHSAIVSGIFEKYGGEGRLKESEMKAWIDKMNRVLAEAGWDQVVSRRLWIEVFGTAIRLQYPLQKIERFKSLQPEEMREAELDALGDILRWSHHADNDLSAADFMQSHRITQEELTKIAEKTLVSTMAWVNNSDIPLVFKRATQAGYVLSDRMRTIAKLAFTEVYSKDLFQTWQMQDISDGGHELPDTTLRKFVHYFEIPPNLILQAAEKMIDQGRVSEGRVSERILKPQLAMIFLSELTGLPVKADRENPLFVQYQLIYLEKAIKGWIPFTGDMASGDFIHGIRKECEESEVPVEDQKKVIVKTLFSHMRHFSQGERYPMLINKIAGAFSISSDFVNSVNPEFGEVWNFYTDETIPLRVRQEVPFDLVKNPKASRARMTHALHPSEFSRIEQDDGSERLLELREGEPDWENIAQALRKNFDEGQSDLIELLELGVQTFGAKVVMQYMNRPGLSRHDALHFMGDIIQLQKLSRLNPKEFAGNILLQVVQDNAQYEQGNGHHEFASVCDALTKETRSVDEILELASTYTDIPRLQEAIQLYRESKAGPFHSWTQLKNFYEIVELLNKKEILDELKNETNGKLKKFVTSLLFHPRISARAVLQFWKEPEKFLEINDQHTAAAINVAKKPSNYLSLPYLGLTAVNLRDAYVNGVLDGLQLLPAMERIYELGEEKIEPKYIHTLIKGGLGERSKQIPGKAKDPKKLFYEIQKFCKEKGILFSNFWDEQQGVDFISGLTPAEQEDLRNLIFDKRYGVEFLKKKTTFRIRIGEKSDPNMVVAGNDTASCMPFGSGKNNVYMFNPGCAQLVLEKKVGRGKWRTVAQSVVTVDVETTKSTPNLIETYNHEAVQLAKELTADDLNGVAVLTCDNIEVAKNELDILPEIREAYTRFFSSYLQTYAHTLDLDPSRVAVGWGYTPQDLELEEERNRFVPLAPMGYSDNVHEQAYLIRTGLSSEPKKMVLGVRELSLRDVLQVAVIEGKAYAENQSTLQYLHGMQNNIIGMQIANDFFQRPNLSYVDIGPDGLVAGYILAYEGINNGLPEIYIADLAADPEKGKGSGLKIIRRLLSQYETQYVRKWTNPLPPLFMEAREKTSFKLVQQLLPKLAERANLDAEVVVVSTEERGDENFLHLRILLGRNQEDLQAQKERYAGLGKAQSLYHSEDSGEYDEDEEWGEEGEE